MLFVEASVIGHLDWVSNKKPRLGVHELACPATAVGRYIFDYAGVVVGVDLNFGGVDI
jgi:hypothetical protein